MKREERKTDLSRFKRRYCRSSRQGKTKLLNELCDLYGYHRKYLLQVLNQYKRKNRPRRDPKVKYTDEELLTALKRLWLASDQACSKRLKAVILLWLPAYEEIYGPLRNEVKTQLLKISAASIDRVLQRHKIPYHRHGLTGTKPGYLLKNQIPTRTDYWDVTQPGFMEADTVAHCGDSMAGNFVWSLTLTDIHTGWTENRATWNKGVGGIIDQIKNIEKNLPFLILGFDCDNGTEFLNWHLIRFFQEERKQAVQFTRSRPYKKNDNAHVEQKNWTHVRHLFGYDRFDNPRMVTLMNDLYANEWSLYQNHFMPSQKLLSKEKINSKYKRKYEQAKTPYQRILESSHIDQTVKAELVLKHEALNPFKLKEAIEKN